MMHTIEEVEIQAVVVETTIDPRSDRRDRTAVADRPARSTSGTASEAHALAALLRWLGRAAAGAGRSHATTGATPRRELPMPFC